MPVDTLLTYGLTFLLVGIGFCLTLHLAARFVLGPVQFHRALVAILPALTIVLSTQLGHPTIGSVLAIGLDFAGIHRSYGSTRRQAALITGLHVSLSLILAVAIGNLLALIGS